MKNQAFQGTPSSPRFALCPSTVKAGDAVLLGKIPAFALNDYQSNTGGATFYTNGTFYTTVVGTTSHSPYTGAAIAPGALLYASGVLDNTTNVTTGLLISATSGDTAFGTLDPSYSAGVGSGLTVTSAPVRI
jgi:predicted RecA/RadA family phage recombinase